MEKLYSLVQTDDSRKADLYIRGQSSHSALKSALHKDEILDFCTYFNSISIKKWRQYTTIQQVMLELNVKGSFELTVAMYSASGEQILIQEKINGPTYRKTWHIDELSGDIAGFSLRALEDGAQCWGGAYYGEFSQWREKKIGIGICTFKREKYVLKTIEHLQDFQENNKWLQVLVVDNGSTLQEQNSEGLRIIHNRNFGGSGGFTRAMIEYVDEDQVDYVLLMDDDIVLDSTALERTHSLLCGLKNEYKDSFLSGAMLRLEEPTIQHENTAYWGKIRLHGFGKGFDVSKIQSLLDNEVVQNHLNQYGAWWYCAIPLHRIRDIGYPLPVFVKGDDMEYGIRNNRPLIHMNGIGVWHQSFAAKVSPVVNYYSDRNMLIINNFAQGCGFFTFIIAVIGRIVKRLCQRNLMGLHMLCLALQDYSTGLTGITKIGSDVKMQQIQAYARQKVSVLSFFQVMFAAAKSIFLYYNSHDNYITFKNAQLKESYFWKKFLELKEKK